MAFLLGLFVFLSSIFIYMFYPRNDTYTLETVQEESAVVSFVEQHQAAKDYIYRLMSYQPDTGKAIYPIRFSKLDTHLPSMMQTKDDFDSDIYTVDSGDAGIEDNTSFNPDPSLETSSGYYTSGLVCIQEKGDGQSDWVACPSDKQYVITYGFMPDWWGKSRSERAVWLKSMLRRTRGSFNCGMLQPLNGQFSSYYGIDNGQQMTGTERAWINVNDDAGNVVARGQHYIVPNGVVEAIQNIVDNYEHAQIEDFLFCISPVENAYKGQANLMFLWDKLNNTGTGPTDATGRPLIGGLATDEITLKNKTGSVSFYTVDGILSVSSTMSASEKELVKISDDLSVRITCNAVTCTLAVGELSTTLPTETTASFAYTSGMDGQKLYLNGEKKSETETLGLPMKKPKFTNDNNILQALRVYEYSLGPEKIRMNSRVDKRRFGF